MSQYSRWQSTLVISVGTTRKIQEDTPSSICHVDRVAQILHGAMTFRAVKVPCNDAAQAMHKLPPQRMSGGLERQQDSRFLSSICASCISTIWNLQGGSVYTYNRNRMWCSLSPRPGLPGKPRPGPAFDAHQRQHVYTTQPRRSP